MLQTLPSHLDTLRLFYRRLFVVWRLVSEVRRTHLEKPPKPPLPQTLWRKSSLQAAAGDPCAPSLEEWADKFPCRPLYSAATVVTPTLGLTSQDPSTPRDVTESCATCTWRTVILQEAIWLDARVSWSILYLGARLMDYIPLVYGLLFDTLDFNCRLKMSLFVHCVFFCPLSHCLMSNVMHRPPLAIHGPDSAFQNVDIWFFSELTPNWWWITQTAVCYIHIFQNISNIIIKDD